MTALPGMNNLSTVPAPPRERVIVGRAAEVRTPHGSDGSGAFDTPKRVTLQRFGVPKHENAVVLLKISTDGVFVQ